MNSFGLPPGLQRPAFLSPLPRPQQRVGFEPFEIDPGDVFEASETPQLPTAAALRACFGKLVAPVGSAAARLPDRPLSFAPAPPAPAGPPPPRAPRPHIQTDDPVETVDIDVRAAIDRQRALDLIKAGRADRQTMWESSPEGIAYERNKPDATMAVIDLYGSRNHDGVERPGHGEQTSALALKASGKSDASLLRVDVSRAGMPDKALDPKDPDFANKFKRSLIDGFVEVPNMLTAALAKMQRDNPKIRTISVSLGRDPAAAVEGQLMMSQSKPEYGEAIAKAMGLPPGTKWGKDHPESAVAAARFIQDVLRNSPEIKQAREKLQKQIDSMPNVKIFAAAGNSGEMGKYLAQHGFRFDRSFAGSMTSSMRGITTVGAGETRRPADGPGRSHRAPYSQQTPVDLATDGQAHFTYNGRPSGETDSEYGTSLSTPRAAGLYDRDPEEYERRRRAALPPEDGSDIGPGYVDTR